MDSMPGFRRIKPGMQCGSDPEAFSVRLSMLDMTTYFYRHERLWFQVLDEEHPAILPWCLLTSHIKVP